MTTASPASAYGRRTLAAVLATLFLCQSCSAGWHQPANLGTEPMEPRQQVQVWREGSMDRWHAVVVTADTVSGIHFLEPLDCDSCRVAVDRASVDSLRVGNPVAGFWKSMALVMGAILVTCFALCPRPSPT